MNTTNPNKVNDAEMAMLRSLADRGFAVVIFTPDEIGEFDERHCVEDMIDYMISAGWNFIENYGKEDEDDDDEDE